MSSAALEQRIAQLWNNAVDLGKRAKFRDMLECWLEVVRFDDQHHVLDHRERARMHLFVGNAYQANQRYREACGQYARAAALYLDLPEIDESTVQWVEETLGKWEVARNSISLPDSDDEVFTEFRARVPSMRVRKKVKKDYNRITVQARSGRWTISFDQDGKNWTFVGNTFEQALGKAREGAIADFSSGDWGPDTEVLPRFPG